MESAFLLSLGIFQISFGTEYLRGNLKDKGNHPAKESEEQACQAEAMSRTGALRQKAPSSFGIAPGFPDGSVGKESTRSTGDPGSIPGSGRSTGEGTGYPLQYCWASLVVQLVKNLPAMQETWVRSLGWEDPLEKGKATHFSILAWRIPWTV